VNYCNSRYCNRSCKRQIRYWATG